MRAAITIALFFAGGLIYGNSPREAAGVAAILSLGYGFGRFQQWRITEQRWWEARKEQAP